MSTTTAKHALTCIACGSHDVRPGVREGAACAFCAKPQMLYEAKTCDCEGYECVMPPEPLHGIGYPFSISDIANATAARLTTELGDEWTSHAGGWGVSGTVSGPYATTLRFGIDNEGDLEIVYGDAVEDDNWPDTPELPEDVAFTNDGVFLVGARVSDGLSTLAERSAAAIRAVIGR